MHKITKNDIKKMEDEIDYRKHVVRPKLLEAVKDARAQGDLSENFEYYAAKKEKNKNESRIRYLDRMIRLSEVIEDDAATDEVGIGDEVTVTYDDGFEDTYTLVTTMSANSLNKCLSIESPVGKAIKGHKVGEKCHVIISKGNEFDVVITKLDKTGKDVEIAPF